VNLGQPNQQLISYFTTYELMTSLGNSKVWLIYEVVI